MKITKLKLSWKFWKRRTSLTVFDNDSATYYSSVEVKVEEESVGQERLSLLVSKIPVSIAWLALFLSMCMLVRRSLS